MNNRIVQIACLVAFALGGLIFFTNTHNLRPGEELRWEFYLMWLTRGTGLFLATAGGLILLLKSIGGSSIDEGMPLVLSIVAGLALISQHWSGLLILGLIVLAHLTVPLFKR